MSSLLGEPVSVAICAVLCRAVRSCVCVCMCSLCSELYADGDGGDDDGQEPAIRRQLRAARAAEKHSKMKAALAEKQAKEVEEATRREQQQQHKQAHRDRIDAWKNKNKVRTRPCLHMLRRGPTEQRPGVGVGAGQAGVYFCSLLCLWPVRRTQMSTVMRALLVMKRAQMTKVQFAVGYMPSCGAC